LVLAAGFFLGGAFSFFFAAADGVAFFFAGAAFSSSLAASFLGLGAALAFLGLSKCIN